MTLKVSPKGAKDQSLRGNEHSKGEQALRPHASRTRKNPIIWEQKIGMSKKKWGPLKKKKVRFSAGNVCTREGHNRSPCEYVPSRSEKESRGENPEEKRTLPHTPEGKNGPAGGTSIGKVTNLPQRDAGKTGLRSPEQRRKKAKQQRVGSQGQRLAFRSPKVTKKGWYHHHGTESWP